MPIPVSFDISTGIISPKPTTRTQLFNTMPNFTTITNIAFEFGPHHLPRWVNLDDALNNIYSEALSIATVESLFADTSTSICMPFNPNAIDFIQSGIPDIITNNSCVNWTVVQLLINSISLYSFVGGSKHLLALQ